MGRAVKEFGTARDEIEKGLNQSGPSGGAQANCSRSFVSILKDRLRSSR
jgi:hypothetical protein